MMSMTPEIYEVCILETMIDSMGHLNNATYLQLFEEARWQWCHDKGVGYDYVVKNQIGFAILEVNLRFGKEVKARENVRIETKIIGFKKKIATIEQVMLNRVAAQCLQCQGGNKTCRRRGHDDTDISPALDQLAA